MYKKIIKKLMSKGIKFSEGLSEQEIAKIEVLYEIEFPESMRNFFKEAIPISDGFYNWRNFNLENVEFIKKIMSYPIKSINDFAKEVYWCENWGLEPDNKMDFEKIVKEKLKTAPKLIPIYGHRYMPMSKKENPPIISVHDTDVIYYGKTLDDYLEKEFGIKELDDIYFRDVEYIPFWTDIM